MLRILGEGDSPFLAGSVIDPVFRKRLVQMAPGFLSSKEQDQVTQQNRRDYIIGYGLASVSYLLILIPQYNTLDRIMALNARIPESSISILIQTYGSMLGVQLSILSVVLAFQAISGVLLLLTSIMGRARKAWRGKYVITSMSSIGYVGYSLGVGFLTSLRWASILASMNVDVSPILQSYYLFNLGAAICYLGVVLVLRRTYTRLSALEARDSLTIRKDILS